MTRIVCQMDIKMEEQQARKVLDDIVEGFELDNIDRNSVEYATLSGGLIPAIRRGRLLADIDNFTIDYKLKTPITFKDDLEPIEVLRFSINDSKLRNVKSMTRAAEQGDPKPLIFGYAKALTKGLDSERFLDDISHGDAATAGAIGGLFLAF
jgi:hypothetical protein